MATIRPTNLLVLHVTAGTPVYLKGAHCPACDAEAMFQFPLLTMTAEAVSTIGLVQICDDCHGREERAKHAASGSV